jgi:cell wall-associated NlpC family hydrolase
MANRIILGAALTLALLFSPGLAQTAPTKSDKKKNSPSKTEKAQTKKSSGVKSSSVKKKKTASQNSGSSSKSRNYSERVQGEMAGIGGETAVSKTPAPSVSASGVPETPPLMKVIPQRDGRFLLEPLSPKKSKGPLSRNPSPQPTVQAAAASERNYNRFEPWNFSDLILTQAGHYKDAPYSRGGSLATGSSTDCSGFVQFIYKGFKIDLPRSSAEQAQVGKVVTQNMDFSKLLPGDLLFFRRGGRHIGHAGIYLGEGKMIHASNRRYGVTITDLRQPYYEGTFVVAKRVFEVKYPQ